jgi:thymidylate synthase (FAD)
MMSEDYGEYTMNAPVSKVTVLGNGHVEYVDHMGNDLTVVNSARVSFNKESDWDSEPHWSGAREHKLGEKDQKLVGYLAKHGHWTPFAHPQITLRIKAPISIRTQFFKHKQGFVENEVSRRYVTDVPDFYRPNWRTAPTGGAKQGSEDFVVDGFDRGMMDRDYHEAVQLCIKRYESLIAKGIAPEQARFVLPQGVHTEWWWTGSLAAYARVYTQRSDPHAQWEIRQYADAISQIIAPRFPVSWKALTGST